MYHPPSYYHQNLGTAGHRASSSYNYMPQYPLNHRPSRSFYAYPPAYPVQMPVPVAVQAPIQAPVEQPVNGGINPVLEYDLNNMATFLSWCAFGMLKQQKSPTKEFDNLIVSVLFATRLPKSTIIIALEYMNQRFSSKNELTSRDLVENEIFVHLVVALVLANKFNDDNTFTNKSWCGATGLDLVLLNEHERAWLDECKWSLNVVNFESNILTLEECWKTWLDKYGASENSSSSTVSPPSYYTGHPHNSIPSSPVYSGGHSNENYYYPSSSPITSSPSKYTQENYAFWPNHHQQPPSIWSHAPGYHAGNSFSNDPAVQYVGANFVGYANPYYNYNLASC
ncbi:uncharacterized protein CANTADRAFT_46306 [Suhomyces tanzawaensis NRRL Y-17324]|uniref:Cyclin N-terminal domain-containing protein n=1 Tax=Suhomyces tanzawaensis NRRL Y-17324 TaxID=984487 RepID=A0A1E4SP33_9ASCO|nr:uncharacterized protein CANTADRAFT_46306 [Suhomyces tanzawaensis NRRL Y-17324]ODV81255.1 hypothetical protein CANTADRAFT_46306 [Suhomyces tanzawaensis NRRL Y-17324]